MNTQKAMIYDLQVRRFFIVPMYSLRSTELPICCTYSVGMSPYAFCAHFFGLFQSALIWPPESQFEFRSRCSIPGIAFLAASHGQGWVGMYLLRVVYLMYISMWPEASAVIDSNTTYLVPMIAGRDNT